MHCRLCGGRSDKVVRYDLSMIGGYWSRVGCDTVVEIRRCRRSGSLFTAELPPLDLILAQYEESVPTFWDGEDANPTEKAARCVDLVRRFVEPGKRVLDVGGGNGAFAIAARHAGFDSWFQDHVQMSSDRLTSEGVVCVSTVTGAPVGTFDMVTLWDVYEHVWPHAEFLAPIRDALRHDGILVIEVPSPNHLSPVFVALGLLLRSPRREWALAQLCNFTHLQLMTARELRHTLPAHGFDVFHVERFSELSCCGVRYARRVVPWERAARFVGELFDRRLVRSLLLGANKTFVAERRTT